MIDEELVLCAFNQYAKRCRCVGYCKKHKCNLTVPQLKDIHCLQKGCRHLVKYQEHTFWKMREMRKRYVKQKNRKRI